MKTIQNVILEDLYLRAVEVSRQTNQTVGEKHDLYITLYQLEQILKTYEPLTQPL